MNTIAIPINEYKNLIKSQDELRKRVLRVEEMLRYSNQDEVTPQYAKKLARLSKEMDEGKGVHFKSFSEMEEYFR
ncbi:MAG: hypothetical protein WC878_02935 [Candidatus Paceibacterota bacterium]|jgi:hypothetical protein